MAIINSYPTATPHGNDLIIGTDVSTTPNSTKTFTIDSINALATGTPAAGTQYTVPMFTSAVAIGDSTLVYNPVSDKFETTSGLGVTSVAGISTTSLIVNNDATVLGNTILGNAITDTLTINATSTFAAPVTFSDDVTINGNLKSLKMGQTTPLYFLDGGGVAKLTIGGNITNNSIINESGAGDLILVSNTELEIKSGELGENYAKFTKDGPIELYYDNSKKFETTTSGVLVTGSITTTGDVILPDNAKLEIGSAAGGDLQIYHDAANSYIDEQGTGNLVIKGSTNVLISTAGGGQMAQFTDTGSAFLYHSGSLKFSTTSAGATVSGDLIVDGGDISLSGVAGINGVTSLALKVAAVTKATITSTKINITSALISNYANNAAALAAGLVAGDLYRNGDSLNIVH